MTSGNLSVREQLKQQHEMQQASTVSMPHLVLQGGLISTLLGSQQLRALHDVRAQPQALAGLHCDEALVACSTSGRCEQHSSRC